MPFDLSDALESYKDADYAVPNETDFSALSDAEKSRAVDGSLLDCFDA